MYLNTYELCTCAMIQLLITVLKKTVTYIFKFLHFYKLHMINLCTIHPVCVDVFFLMTKMDKIYNFSISLFSLFSFVKYRFSLTVNFFFIKFFCWLNFWLIVTILFNRIYIYRIPFNLTSLHSSFSWNHIAYSHVRFFLLSLFFNKKLLYLW